MTHTAFKNFDLTCPHCSRVKWVRVNDAVPVQRFDLRCCGEQVVTARVLKATPQFTVRELTWEAA